MKRILYACIACCAVSLPSYSAGLTPGPDSWSATSASWKVKVVSAASYTEARINPDNPFEYLEPRAYSKDKFNLTLNLRFEYSGPPAMVSAPRIEVIDNQGNKFGALGHLKTSSSDGDALGWLVSLSRTEPDKRSLKGGEKFGADAPITFYVTGIPIGATGLKLVFADVPPIPLTPRCVIEKSLFNRILDEHLTEAEVSTMFGPGKPSGRAGVPKGMKELVWRDGSISITVQFLGGKANGGTSSNLK